ncbi:MAG: hypothetical protein MMC23_004678 [Stictis urceolatum]|nr:hypothetical protein [Stictis urceolata]
MSRFLALAAILALAAAVPYPPDVAVSVAAPAESPFFGNKDGDFQPSKTIPEAGSPHVLAQGGVVTAGAQTDSINNQDGIGDGVDQYITYSGDGSQGAGWPTEQQWVSFENMFNNNKAIMFSSCSADDGPNDSGPEVGAICDAIQDAASKDKSDGCVRVHTTNYGVRNPGLMQDHNGSNTCNENGNKQNPCPTDVIFGMVSDGTAGTDDGDGLAQTLNQASNSYQVTLSRAFYIAARLYNWGSVADSNRLEDGIATHCYSSDIVNRLTGWASSPHTCPFDG